MNFDLDMQLEGFEGLETKFAELEKLATRRAAARRALKLAASPIAVAANGFAPVGATGEYAVSFTIGTKLNDRQASLHRKMFRDDRAGIEMFVGTNDPAGVQQEFGNANHPAQPALRPAWDAEAIPTLDRLAVEMWDEVQKAVARANRRRARG